MKLDLAQLEDRLTKLMRKHDWISRKRDQFGVAGSQFDWSVRNPSEAMSEYQHAQATIQSIGNRIDPAVMPIRLK